MNKNKSYDILIMAGQSNAEGNGLGECEYVPHIDGVFQIVDINNAGTYDDER